MFSYLCCNLLIDYGSGERYFAATFNGWDLGNATQGREPSYTVFNPIGQVERNDPDGEHIWKEVPELKKEFDKLGYPNQNVDWDEMKQRAAEGLFNSFTIPLDCFIHVPLGRDPQFC
ncbi:uncharacterized protein Z518_08322 [Rhinocladiella mackenziei CBS 650.93]|uniref:Cryptochrome/DNA photolyase FAD-binding domain-containing protein n=1 Tax=Rhinocladiella mackenziei CBS 650.93 TaxID=1442369 RepID=A0A0D2IGG4_9EURO|nr:uncharacterized protein Z518_08322 [Rhinocladiella mackenziei CBS 650.93]KIX02381.1 hypothetical protein Z518_08322 [Rhinocladiella mackenziei CBS 650.93]